MTQDLFDSIIDHPESSVVSSSVSTNISMTPKIIDVEPIDDKSELPSEIIEDEPFPNTPVDDLPKISPDLPMNDKLKFSNEESTPQLEKAPSSLPTRAEREARFRECAVKYGEDPDKFVTITEKDRDLVMIFQDKMMADAEIIDFAREEGRDPEEDMELTRRDKLICMEIKLRMYEDDGEPRSYTRIYDDEEWKKNIAILRENGYLW
ncbi:hypothetical protein Glove_566g30 [Diversispora epigaea]|uniref:Uncharacterized protein n=1 Tax=Diversispora epigaea TaxID=1348612 RepID=A0A397GCK7_9GLOM|nr:hypothetical protein Glove_566g30 [Diversispora epigaea]